MLLFLLGSQRVQAQAGTFTIPLVGNPVNDPATGITYCTINWTGLQLPLVRVIQVIISLSGDNVCLNPATGLNPTVINAGFTPAFNYSNTFTHTSLTITKAVFSGSFVPRPSPTCFPGASFEEALFSNGHYDFPQSPYSFPCRITPRKTGNGDLCCGIDPEDFVKI